MCVCVCVLSEIQLDKEKENSHPSDCLETPYVISVPPKLLPPRTIAEFFILAGIYQTPTQAFGRLPELKIFHP